MGADNMRMRMKQQDLDLNLNPRLLRFRHLLKERQLAERLALYEEGVEAVFWSEAEECAAQCHRLLANDALRESIPARGQRRTLRNNLFNEPMLAAVIEPAVRAFEAMR